MTQETDARTHGTTTPTPAGSGGGATPPPPPELTDAVAPTPLPTHDHTLDTGIRSKLPDSAVATGAFFSLRDIAGDDWRWLVRNTNLDKALVVDPADLSLQPVESAAFLIARPEDLARTANTFNADYSSTRSCDNEVEVALAKSNTIKGSATVSYAMVSASVKTSATVAEQKGSATRTVTAVGRTMSPRMTLFLTREVVAPSDAFLARVREALSQPTIHAQSERLSEVFDRFGLVWAQEITLGAASTVETQVEVSASFSDKQVEMAVSAGLSAKYGGASGKAEMSASHQSDDFEKVRNEIAQASSTSLGGLGGWGQFQVIARDRLSPLYDILPPDVRAKVVHVLNETRPELSQRLMEAPPPAGGPPTDHTVTPVARRHVSLDGDAILMLYPGPETTDKDAATHLSLGVDDGPTAYATRTGKGGTRTSGSIMLPVRWHDSFCLGEYAPPAASGDREIDWWTGFPMQWMMMPIGVSAGTPAAPAAPRVEVIRFRAKHHTCFTPWGRWFTAENGLGAGYTSLIAHQGTATSDVRFDEHAGVRDLVMSPGYAPATDGFLLATLEPPVIAERAEAQTRLTALIVTQKSIRGVMDTVVSPKAPAVPVRRSMCIPVRRGIPIEFRFRVAGLPATMTPDDEAAAVTRLLELAFPLEIWFAGLRGAVAELGVARDRRYNDQYTAQADGFVVCSADLGETVGVTVEEPGPVKVPGTGQEVERASATVGPVGTTLTVPVRQDETYRPTLKAVKGKHSHGQVAFVPLRPHVAPPPPPAH